MLIKKFPKHVRRSSVDQTQMVLPELAILDFWRSCPVTHRTQVDNIPDSEYPAEL
jgi:hypothetical protein